jgi:integrase
MDIVQQFINKIPSYIKDKLLLQKSKSLMQTLAKTLKPSTIQTYISEIRSKLKILIKDQEKISRLFAVLRISDEEQEKIKNKAKFHTTKHIRKSKVDVYIENFKKKLYSYYNFHDLTVFLLVVSGRRTIEILKLGLFEKSEKEGHVFFSGSAKLKTKEDEKYEIPLLVDPEYFLKTFKYYRYSYQQTDTNQKTTIKYAATIRSRVRKLFGDELTSHDLRRSYAALCFDKFKPKLDRFYYYQKILGHYDGWINTTSCYLNIDVINSETL